MLFFTEGLLNPVQNYFKNILKIDLRGIRMDPYRSVWVRMVPGDLFQGFPGPKPLKNIEQIRSWGFGVGGGSLSPGPCGLPSSLRGILSYMALWPAYGWS